MSEVASHRHRSAVSSYVQNVFDKAVCSFRGGRYAVFTSEYRAYSFWVCDVLIPVGITVMSRVVNQSHMPVFSPPGRHVKQVPGSL